MNGSQSPHKTQKHDCVCGGNSSTASLTMCGRCCLLIYFHCSDPDVLEMLTLKVTKRLSSSMQEPDRVESIKDKTKSFKLNFYNISEGKTFQSV